MSNYKIEGNICFMKEVPIGLEPQFELFDLNPNGTRNFVIATTPVKHYAELEYPLYLKSIEDAPKDGTFILLFGDSGYISTPMRCEVGYWSEAKQRWNNHANDAFTDGGAEPLFWCKLPDYSVAQLEKVK